MALGFVEPKRESDYDKNLSLALNQPHSATRFLLPFNLPPAAEDQGRASEAGASKQTVYRQARAGDLILANQEARSKYLTAETRNVLFTRATWWVMNCAPAPINMTAPDGKQLRGMVRPPSLVLFEDACGKELLRRGFLVVEVAFQRDVNAALRLDDVLLFNELFRFWREPFKGDGKAITSHSEKFKKQLHGFAEPFTKMTGFAVNGSYGERWKSMLRVPLEDGRALLSDGACDANEIFGDYADDRAFVWTRALLSKPEIQRIIPHPEERSDSKWQAEETDTGFRKMFGYWVKLLNVDMPGDSSNKTTAFERDWAADRTYRRWEHCNCYYGFNYFSAAMMAEKCDDPPIWQHWFEMYFDQVLLLLYVRVTLFRFSEQLTEISGRTLGAAAKTQSCESLENWKSDFRKLRKAFTCFENLFQWPLLSNQQQAVEMYVCARRSMDIDELYEEISKEIKSSDELLEAEVEEKQAEVDEDRNKFAYVLNKIAIIGLGLSVALSCYQIEALKNDWKALCGINRLPGDVFPLVVLSALWIGFFWSLAGMFKWYTERYSNRGKVPVGKS